MIKMWLSKSKCTGCGACANGCSKGAIRMEADACGFLYPVIGEGCIDCGRCKNICEARTQVQRRREMQTQSVLSEPTERTKQTDQTAQADFPVCLAAWSKEAENRFASTSGGLFYTIGRRTLRDGGVVCGAAFDEDNMVYEVMARDEEGLKRLRQSKYLQSDARGIYKEIKSSLAAGVQTTFCGAPCQVAALYAYLGKECKGLDKLLTVDFICRGVNSPKAYRAWLDEVEAEKGCKASKVWFKYKSKGWKNSPRCTRVDFKDGSHLVFDGEENLYMNAYLSTNLFIRPSCCDCDFKGMKRQGDITLADFWGVGKSVDDDKGTSLVLLNSKKGADFFKRIQDELYTQKRSTSEIAAGNICLDSSVKQNPKSESFLKSLDTLGFREALDKYTRMGIIMGIKQKIKRVLKGSTPEYKVTVNHVTPDEALKGKRAVVIGGGSGIGEAIAMKLNTLGAEVIICSRNPKKQSGDDSRIRVFSGNSEDNSHIRVFSGNSENMEHIRVFPRNSDDTERIYAIPWDVSDAKKIAATFLSIVEKFGDIDIVVNSQGICPEVDMKQDFLAVTPEDFDDVMTVNLKSVYFICQEACRYFMEQHRGGNILNIASTEGLKGVSVPYGLSKCGIISLTKGLAKKMAPHHIVINAIAPGATATAMMNKSPEGNLAYGIPSGRYTLPAEIAEAAAMLLTDSGRQMCGSVITVDGGESL